MAVKLRVPRPKKDRAGNGDLTPMLKVPDVSKRLGVSEATVRYWLREGMLVGTRLPSRRSGWRVEEHQLREFIQKYTVATATT